VATSVQFVVVKSAFCCNTNFIEGTNHEMRAWASEGVIFRAGEKVGGDRFDV
jgi:hypothetical protein